MEASHATHATHTSSHTSHTSHISGLPFLTVSIAKEAAEEWVIVELVVVKESRKEIICLFEVKVVEDFSFGPLKAISVINLSLFRVRQVFISFWYFSKPLNSFFLVIGIFIRVPLNSCFFISLLDFSLSSLLIDSKYLIIVLFWHCQFKMLIKKL